MNNNLISIIVPLFNYAHYISDLIESVISQNYKLWELIIVDDFSTDNPLKIIKKYNDDRISYYKLNKNSGYSVAKNKGILRSRGQFIAILDADDMLCPKSLSRRRKFFIKHNRFEWVHAKAYEFSDSKPYKFKYKKRKFIKHFEKIKKTKDYSMVWAAIHAQTVMVRRIVYEKAGLYEESMKSMSDKEMWARINNNIGRPGYLDKFVAYYRMHKKQMHRSKKKIRELPKLKKQLKGFIKKRKNGRFEGVRLCPKL